MLNKILLVLLHPVRAIAVLLLAAAVNAWAQLGPVLELDRIVAIVNDDVIVFSALDARMRTVRTQLRKAGTPQPPEHLLRKQVLERIILNRLQVQLAQATGIRVDDETLNRTLTRLAAQSELTLRQFRDILERDGYDFAKFREEVRNEILIAELRKRQVENRIQVSDRDIENYLGTIEKQGGTQNEYHIAQILVAVPEGASSEQIAEAKKEADEIVGALAAGADFARLSVTQSDGQQALEGGDLGWRKAIDLPTIFADIVPAMQAGAVSEPLRSASGFHVVKLLDVRGDRQHLVTQTHARHIVITTDELTDDATAKQLLEQLTTRLENNDAFADLARAHSDDPGSAGNGGDLGWLTPGDVVPEFQAMMDSLKPGELSKPFKSQYGWHIVEILARREHDDTEQVRRAEARDKLRKRKIEEELQTWLRQVRDEAYVEYRLEE